MATQSLYGVPLVDPSLIINGSTGNSFNINASTNGIASIFIAERAVSIDRVIFNVASVLGTTPTFRWALEGVTSRNTPDGTIKGSGTVKYDSAPSGSGLVTASFGAAYTPSIGEILALTCRYQSGTIDGSNRMNIYYGTTAYGTIGGPYGALLTAGSWGGAGSGVPCMAPLYSDGVVGRRFVPFSSITNNTPTSSSNPKYYGSYWVPALSMTLSGVLVGARMAAGSSFTVSLFEGTNTTAVASLTVNPDLASSTTGGGPLFVPLAYTLTAGTVYRFVVSMTTATAFTVFASASFTTQAAHDAFWGPLYGCTGSSGSLTWTDYVSGSDWRAYPVIPCVDSITASGGGLLTQRAWTGGVAA